jgi:hypothetical protein
MKFLDLVSCCDECLYKSYYSGGRSECTKTRTLLPFNEGHTIPDWCPLPDYPSNAMAKQAAEAKDAGEREVKAWAERDQYMQSNVKLVAEIEQLREALAGDQQRLFHYEGAMTEMRAENERLKAKMQRIGQLNAENLADLDILLGDKS